MSRLSETSENAAPADTSLAVLVPVYNEQHLVEASLSRLRILGESLLLRRIKVIVVDDCSTDETPAALARFQESLDGNFGNGKFEWVFLRHERNLGKGAGIQTALAHADTELTIIHDADLEYHPRDIPQMVSVAREESADAIFGSRFLPGQYHRVLFFRHALGNNLLTFLCDLITDLNISDMETCYKMVRTPLLKSIPLESRDFRIEPELTIKLAKRGARIFEVPISYSGRTYQEGKKINWKDGVLAFWALVKYGLSDQVYKEDQFGKAFLTRLHQAVRFSRWRAQALEPYVGRRVLEIGAGTGHLTVHLTPRQAYWATDVNPLFLDSLHELARTRPYLQVQFTDVTRPETFPSEKFDTVVSVNVLEHIEDDAAALRNIWNALEPGGRVIVLVAQGPGLYGSLDRVLGRWRRYTETQLRALAVRCGFSVQQILPFNRAGSVSWWFSGKILRREAIGPLQIRTLNLFTPIFQAVDPWLPLPPLSLIGIFEKVPNKSA